MRLLPLGEASSKNAHLLRHRYLLLDLDLALLAAGLSLSFATVVIGSGDGTSPMLGFTCPNILQSGARTSLFGKGAVEDDGFGVFELTKQGGQFGVELMGRNPF